VRHCLCRERDWPALAPVPGGQQSDQQRERARVQSGDAPLHAEEAADPGAGYGHRHHLCTGEGFMSVEVLGFQDL
jgi:hypothetical protein